MAYTLDQFNKVVAKYGGVDRIVSLTFNNSYVVTLDITEKFSERIEFDEAEEMIIIKSKDTSNRPYKIVKPIEYLEAIVFAENDEDMKYLDRRYIRG